VSSPTRHASALLALLLALACGRDASGPQPIAWDREPCGHCKMLVGERAFAAQAIRSNGRAVAFDDPGCLFAWLQAGHETRELWFHHLREERWLRAPAVAFVTTGKSPMGHGLGAVDPATEGAIGLDDARRRVAEELAR
jgi:copper chaperone NosL